jgi:hypothetical protein
MERVLIHMEDPVAVLSEVRRVPRPGGVPVVQEYDYRCLIYDAPDAALSRMMSDGIARAMLQPEVGAALARHARATGHRVTEVVAELTRMPDFTLASVAFRWREPLAALVDEGTVTEARAEAWWTHMREMFEAVESPCHNGAFALYATR